MRRRELEEIALQVKENSIKLSKCDLHNFHPMPHWPMRYKCSNCGGEAEVGFVKGYNQGLEHNSIEDIIKGDK